MNRNNMCAATRMASAVFVLAAAVAVCAEPALPNHTAHALTPTTFTDYDEHHFGNSGVFALDAITPRGLRAAFFPRNYWSEVCYEQLVPGAAHQRPSVDQRQYRKLPAGARQNTSLPATTRHEPKCKPHRLRHVARIS